MKYQLSTRQYASDEAVEKFFATFAAHFTFNDHGNFPPYEGQKFKQISEKDFYWPFIYSPTFTEFRQVRPEFFEPTEPFKGAWIRSIHLSYFPDGSVVGWTSEGDSIQYWRIKMPHELKSTNIGNCLNRYDCQICKYSNEVDSSG